MPDPRERALRFRPRGVCDTVDGENSPPGACMSLSNLIFDPGTPGVLQCRPANLLLNDFTGFDTSVVAVGNAPQGMALTPDGTKLFVCNLSDGTVSVISTATNTVIETITVDSLPSSIVITPDGTKAYVCYLSGTAITKIVISGYATTDIDCSAVGDPACLAVTPDGTKLYFGCGNTNLVGFITVSSGVVSGTTITTAPASSVSALVFTPDGTQLYACNEDDASVSIINVSTSLVTSTVNVGNTPTAIAASPDGLRVYVGNSQDGTVSVILVSSGLIINTILLPGATNSGISDIAISADSTMVYVVDAENGWIDEITAATGAISIFGEDTFEGPNSIVLTAEFIYVSNASNNTVSVVGFSNVVTAAFVLGDIVFGLIGDATTGGKDIPFAYNISSATFLTLHGVTATNVPASQATSGAWTPPDMDMVGERIFVTHVGFNFADGFAFGFFDISSFSDATTANTTTSTVLTGNPNIQGLAPGYLITGTGIPAGAYVTDYAAVNISTTCTTHSNTTLDSISSTAGMAVGQTVSGLGIPPSTVITAVMTNSLTISNAATTGAANTAITVGGATITMSAATVGSASGVSIVISGGTPTNPLWCAGNTTGEIQLAGVAACVKGFNNRTYFGQSNNLLMTDTLSVNVSNADGVQVLTVGDSTPVVKIGGIAEYQSTGGILQAIVAFKANFLQQVTGDPATSDLVQTSLTGYPGTSAPRSVVTGPNGLFYMANDGLRTINQLGQVSDPDPDLALPFIYAVEPSRVAAAYNSDIYRICTQNGDPDVPGNPYQGYYYDQRRKAWNGPHTFRDDLLVPYDNDFLSFSNAIPGTMWQSFSVQGHNDEGNTFVENGQPLTWDYETSPMSTEGNMYANAVIRSTLDMLLPATGDTYQFQAQDAARGVLATATLTAVLNAAIWDAFDWGDGTLWGAAQSGLGPRIVPWTQPLIFNKLVLSASGNSSLALKLGAWYNGYEKLNYLMQ